MFLTKYTPQSAEVFNQFFNDEFFSSSFYPALDVIEEKEQYILKADLPGVKKEDIKVTVEDGVLSIQGERKAEVEQKDAQAHRIERNYGRFTRSLKLGTDVDQSRLTASYKDGVLQLTLPKAEAAKPKSIDIHVD